MFISSFFVFVKRMAKSIRSKHRRQMRNIKRQKFAQKELVKLKATVMRDILNKDSENAMEEVCTSKLSVKAQNCHLVINNTGNFNG